MHQVVQHQVHRVLESVVVVYRVFVVHVYVAEKKMENVFIKWRFIFIIFRSDNHCEICVHEKPIII